MTSTLAGVEPDVLRGTWSIDPSHSELGFKARHAMVDNVYGRFNEFSGTITIDPDDPSRSSAEVEIEAASIDTKNADRDNHLRTGDFFEIEKHPRITFRSTRVEAGDDEGEFKLRGELTIRGVTREVELDIEFQGVATDPFGNTRAGFVGETTVNRQDWGLTWNAPLEKGGFLVSDKVKLTLDVSAIKQQDNG